MSDRKPPLKCLPGHRRVRPAAALEALAGWCRERDVDFECYGRGALAEDFEKRVAELLGFPAARFMPSGTMAQGIALRVWCDRVGRRHFGMHPSSHLELHEERGYQHLWDLEATLVGPFERPLLAEHLAALAEPISALLTELPIREAGGQLPTWEQLEELKSAARARGVKLHCDGARIWETAPYYNRSYAEITRGFDSVYVSFYKGIGGFAGAMLLGPEDFIAESRVWQRRVGGNLFTMGPIIASAAKELESRLALMPRYCQRAVDIVAALADIEGLRFLPARPQVNMVHIFLPFSAAIAHAARDRLVEEQGLILFGGARDAGVPGIARAELSFGDASLEWSDAEVRQAFVALLAFGREAAGAEADAETGV